MVFAIRTLCKGVSCIMTKIFKTDDIGLIVRNKRIELGLTQSQLADVSGNGTRFISELENGKKTVQTGKVLNTLNVLGFDVVITTRGEL